MIKSHIPEAERTEWNKNFPGQVYFVKTPKQQDREEVMNVIKFASVCFGLGVILTAIAAYIICQYAGH
jgi:hypothetical protein